MTLLITGAGGQLGGELAELSRNRDVATVALTRHTLDITDQRAVGAALDEHRPEAVVNCAAWTNVDGAETHPDEAYAINETGAHILAEACACRDIRLVHLSTDYVFDGVSPGVSPECATPAPLSIYGASKLAGEKAVRAASENHVIVRTSGLYGRDGPNFVLTILQCAATGAELRVVADQVTAPTWTRHLGTALLRLVDLRVTGTYHITNSGTTSWFGFAVAALRHAGCAVEVVPTHTLEFAAAARRPQRAVLGNRRWLGMREPPLPSWSAALRGYIDELRRRGTLPRSPGSKSSVGSSHRSPGPGLSSTLGAPAHDPDDALDASTSSRATVARCPSVLPALGGRPRQPVHVESMGAALPIRGASSHATAS